MSELFNQQAGLPDYPARSRVMSEDVVIKVNESGIALASEQVVQLNQAIGRKLQRA